MVKPKVIFSDFDGTLTYGHSLQPCFFDILNLCHQKSVLFVIVTGRSKSWAHFLLSHFPTLDWVISEGGGVLSGRASEDKYHRLFDQLLVEEEQVERLEAVTGRLLEEYPSISLSVDSFGRQTDRAIELGWLKEKSSSFDEIKKFFDRENINWSTSNVHMNYWCGEVSKALAIDYFLTEKTSFNKDEGLFFGDSLNDQSAFQYFSHSVGVSNIQLVLDQLEYRPSVVLEGKDNRGPFGVLNYLTSVLK